MGDSDFIVMTLVETTIPHQDQAIWFIQLGCHYCCAGNSNYFTDISEANRSVKKVLRIWKAYSSKTMHSSCWNCQRYCDVSLKLKICLFIVRYLKIIYKQTFNIIGAITKDKHKKNKIVFFHKRNINGLILCKC